MELEGQTFFKLNSAKLIPSAQTRLKQIAAQIRKNGYKGSIRITGNTCGLGDPVYDQRLSERRAKAVRNFLIKNGFNANRLIARGLGKGHPKYPNTPDQGFKNRRVDIEYVTERKAFKTGYRTETKTVRTGTRRVVAGFKNVPAGSRNVMISSGRAGSPRVIWRTEVIPTSPAWIKRALHNNITHNTSVSTYQTTAGSTPTPVNVAPVAVDDTKTVSCSTAPVTINVLGNDHDQDGDKLTITKVQNGQYGTTKIVGNQIVYTPNGSGCGKTDTFTYTITDGHGHSTTANVNVKVKAQNVAPIAKDDSATTNMGQAVTLTTLANDSDADGDNLTITHIDTPAHGTAVVSADGKGIVYTPNPGWFGTETFNYSISDGHGHIVTATETVVVKAPAPVNVAPVAANDTKTTVCSTDPVVVNVLNNDYDPDGDALTITNVGNPAYGTAEIVGNQIIYTPDGSGCGKTDNFSYTISDGHGHSVSANVQVNMQGAVNVPPVAQDDSATTDMGQAVTLTTLANDSDADGDTLTISHIDKPAHGTAVISANGKGIVYTPNPGWYGTETFNYSISDGHGHTVSATETVIVKAPAVPLPEAKDDSATVETCTPKLINVLANDNQGSGNATVTVTSGPSHGGVEVKANGKILYWADDNYVGNDSFTYQITDSNGKTSSATVSITVTGQCQNDAPTAKNDKATTQQGEAVALNTLSNDSDPDGDTLEIIKVQNPAHGVAEIMGGQIVYQPNADFVGTEKFTYTISDGNGNTATATETVVVEAADCNQACTKAESDDIATVEGESVRINVLANDAGKGLKITSVDNPKHGTAKIVGKTIKYTPDAGFVGTESFWYDIVDAKGYRDSALIVVYVDEAGCDVKCK
jgi:hypothetical protein